MPDAVQAEDSVALKAKMSAMEAELQQMQVLVGEAMEQAQVGYRISNASRAEVETLNKKLESALEESQQLSVQRIEEKSVIQRYKSENLALDAELEKLKQALERARDDAQQLKAELTGAKIARTEIETELLFQKKVAGSANEEVAKQGAQLTASQQETRQELQRLKNELANAQADRMQIVVELGEQKKLAEEKSLEATNLNLELTEARKELSAAAVGVEGQRQMIEETREAARAREEALEKARRQVVELKDGLANANTNIRDLQAEFDGLAGAIEANVKQLIETATAQLRSDVSSVGVKLQTTVKEINDLSATSVEAKIPAEQ